MSQNKTTCRRLVNGNAIPTFFGMCIFAALVAMTTTAGAQDFRATEAIVRSRLAQADAKKALEELAALRKQCAGGSQKACAGCKAAEQKLQRIGCAAFPGAAEQSFCLATVARVSAETTQVGLEVAQHLNQRTFMKSRSTETKVVSGVAVTTTNVDYAELTLGGTTSGVHPCFDYTDLTGGTAETPGTMRQIKCHDVPRVTEYDGRPINVPAPPPANTELTSWSRTTKVIVTAVVATVVLGAAGAGIGYGLSENFLDPNTGERKDHRGRNAAIGGGVGALVGALGGAALGFAF